MRLDKLTTLLDGVDFTAFPKFDVGRSVSNLDPARAEFLRLAEAPELSDALEPILNSKVFATDRDEFVLTEADELRAAVYRLQLLIVGLREALKYHAAAPSPESIVIKLPDPADFADALQTAEQFRLAIDQVIANKIIGGQIKLLGWETGSFWLYLALGTPAAVTLIGSVAWAAAVVRKKVLEGTILKKKVEAMEIHNDALDAVREGIEREVDLLLTAEAKAIYKKHFNAKDDPEQLQRIQYTIKTFSELIGKGAEVHPSLQVPEAVANLFPDPAKLNSVASKIAQLTDKPSNDE